MESTLFIKLEQDLTTSEEPLVCVKNELIEPMNLEIATDPLDVTDTMESTYLDESEKFLSKMEELVPTIKQEKPEPLDFEQSGDFQIQCNADGTKLLDVEDKTTLYIDSKILDQNGFKQEDADSESNINGGSNADVDPILNDVKLKLSVPLVRCGKLETQQSHQVQEVQIKPKQEVQESEVEGRQEIQEKLNNIDESIHEQCEKYGKRTHRKRTEKKSGFKVLLIKGWKYFSCESCLYMTISSKDIEKHVLTHSIERPFHCNICSFKTTTSLLLKRHKTCHLRDKPFVCSACQYETTRKQDFKSHLATHSEVKPHKCSMCTKSYTRFNGLKRHIKVNHKGDKPSKCSICPYSCVGVKDLKRHVLKHHDSLTNSEMKSYTCSLCSFCSVTKYELKRHCIVHTGLKPLECLQCPYRCGRADLLKLHILNKHSSGEQNKSKSAKPCKSKYDSSVEPAFICDYCGYSCSGKQQIASHIMRIHTGFKPLAYNHAI